MSVGGKIYKIEVIKENHKVFYVKDRNDKICVHADDSSLDAPLQIGEGIWWHHPTVFARKDTVKIPKIGYTYSVNEDVLKEEMEVLKKLGIEKVPYQGASIGFAEKNQSWYGWSHRAIAGFKVGSKVKMGDCAFQPSNKEEFAEYITQFWGDEKYLEDVKITHTKTGVKLTAVYNNKVPNKDLRGTPYVHFEKYPKKWGRGAWTAKTLDDAKQMAIDFSKDVS